MSSLRFNENGVFQIDDSGEMTRAVPIPFQVLNRLGGWQPICIKHKLIFKNLDNYYAHYTSVCSDYPTSEVPPSDYKKHLVGYRKAEL